MSLGAEIREVLFTPVRLREGYNIGDVDDFLDVLAAAADRGEALRRLVDDARFAPVRLREGYDMGEVDAFLERVAGGVTPGGSVIEEHRGLISRCIRRRD